MTRVNTLKRYLLVLFLLLALGACSSTTFFYNRLDFILPWYVQDYVELNGQQEQYLDELLRPFLARHRVEELPTYLAILGQIEALLDRPEPLIAADIETIWLGAEEAGLRLEAQALDWLLDLGGELSDEQIEEFLENLEEQQAEFEEEYLERTDEEFVEDTIENMENGLKDYLGRLDDGQQQLLADTAGGMMRSDTLWLAERGEWVAELRQLLQREPGWEQALRDTIKRRRDSLPEPYVAMVEHNSALLYDMTAQLLNSRSEKQDRKLRKRLKELSADLQTLIAQADELD